MSNVLKKQSLILGYTKQYHRIVEYLKLEGIHKDH